MPESEAPLGGVVSRIASVLGSGLGATVGAQAGDPVTGAMVGETLAQLGDDFVQRVLSPRQEQRVATVLDLASERITEGIADGNWIRDDGFFDAPHLDATEVFEGVLLAARDENEAKKLPYLANLLADISFDENVTVDMANLVIREAESMSWLQLCLLAIVSRPDDFPLPEVETGTFGASWGDWTVSDTFHSMIAPEGAYIYHPKKKTENLGLATYDLMMNHLKLTNRGMLLAGMLRLQTVPATDLEGVYKTLIDTARARAKRDVNPKDESEHED